MDAASRSLTISNDRHQLELDPLHLFKQWVEKTPDKIAVTCGDESLTYQQLNIRTNQLANHLVKSHPVGAIAAVFLTPSVNTVIALIALMKAGLTYAPIDPDFPDSRVDYLCKVLLPQVVLTQTNLLDRINGFIGTAEQIELDQFANNFDVDLDTTLIGRSGPNSTRDDETTAYVFFTSGTTGEPKGVVGNVKNLKHFIHSALAELGLSQNTHMVSVAKFTFSISLFELFAPLCAGGQITLLAREQVLDTHSLISTLDRVNTLHFSPTLLRRLFSEIEHQRLPADRFGHIIHASTGGDLIPLELLQKLRSTFSGADIFTVYGCSEIAVMGCRYPVSDTSQLTRTPVGQPFARTSVRVLGEDHNDLPTGEKGEIYFSGPGVSPGYLNKSELTTEKFIELDGKTFYRTGDIGLFDAQDNLIVLGRSDFQVKINGIRIELGEVDAYVRRLPGVADALTAAHKVNESGDLRIFAYVVPDGSVSLSTSRLLEQLRQQLPEYSLPVGFIVLEALPLNINLKVDRKALPKPTPDLLLSDKAGSAVTTTQNRLLNLWEQELLRQNIGISDNFFALGGNSIIAVSLLAKIQNEFQLNLPIQTLLEYQTIYELANEIDKSRSKLPKTNAFKLNNGDSTPLFCFYGVLLYRQLAQALPKNQSVYGVFLQEEVDLLANGDLDHILEKLVDVKTIAHKYVDAIQEVQSNGPYYLCGVSFGGIVALETARILQEQGQEIRFLGMLDTWTKDFRHRSIVGKVQALFRTLVQDPRLLVDRFKNKVLSRFSKPMTDAVETNADDLTEVARNKIISNYVATRYTSPVVLYKAASRSPLEPRINDLGWGKYLPSLDVKSIPGDHLSILQFPNVEKLAKDIEQYLPSSADKKL